MKINVFVYGLLRGLAPNLVNKNKLENPRGFSLIMKIYIIKFQNRSEHSLKKDYKIIFLQYVVQISREEQVIGFIQKLNLIR